MKIFDNILKVGTVVLASLVTLSCENDELVKPSALISESSLTFAAVGAEAQTLTVASDEEWYLDVSADWITLGQTSGKNTEKVVVSVADNKSGDVVGAPREGIISITNNRGYIIETIVYQKGDSFYGVSDMDLGKVASLEDGQFAKVPDIQVLAVGPEGFVARDGVATRYLTYDKAAGLEPVAIGQVLHIGGEKTTLYAQPSLKVGQIDVLSQGEVTYPTPVDLAAGIAAGGGSALAYVSTYAGLLGRSLNYDTPLPGGVSASLLEASSDVVDLDAVNMHNIAVEAYFVGVDGSEVKLLVTKCEDKGVNENLNAYFYDDFSWMKSFIDASGVKVGDSIGENNASADAPNLRTTSALAPLLDELVRRGYEDLNQSAKVIYPQAYYWKFGKTSNHGGMKLPPMSFDGAELVNVFLEFDWAAHMTGSGNIDKVQVVAEVVEGPGVFANGTAVSDPLYTTQEKGHIEWQHAVIEIKGVNENTRIVLRPDKFAEADPDQQRWHLDNIKIKNTGVPYSDPVYANVTLSDEVLTFEGTPGGPATFTVKSDNPWTITASPGNEWFSLDVTEGAANEEVTVTVTCEPSSSVNLRHGYVTIASADTRKNIHVVQSAAGGQLDPLISLNKNNVTIIGEGGAFSVNVQANVEYGIEIQDEWITGTSMATKSVVEKHSHDFTASANLTGTPRVGYVRFYNEQYGIESILKVTQGNFEPRVDIDAPFTYLGVSGAGCTVKYSVDASIPYTISSDAAWIKFPAAVGKNGVYDVPVTFEANPGAGRTATITIKNEEYDYVKTLTVKQFDSGVVYFDDFGWLAPAVAMIKKTAPGNYDTVGEHDLKAKATNIYTTSALKNFFVPEINSIGYVIPGKADGANDVVYLQENYLKMGKTSTNSQTSLTLPGLYAEGKNVELSFDWCRMEQGDGTIDNYTITLKIEGAGTFDNGTKYSDELSTPQEKGQMFWTTVSARIKGADSTTRVTIVASDLLDKSNGNIDYKKSGGRRMFIDNIKVVAE